MKRQIVKIDAEKCDGCGLCVSACAEGALQLINGKAVLVSESYCDGLGACLPECPRGAITIEEREAAPFDEEAVKKHPNRKAHEAAPTEKAAGSAAFTLACGCPGTEVRAIRRNEATAEERAGESASECSARVPHVRHSAVGFGASVSASGAAGAPVSRLRQWPCQIQLVPVNTPYLDNAHLLIAADCTAYAYANIHEEFMNGKITLIGCPKLDEADYAAKLTEILVRNEIKSITVLKMEVPCCGRLLEMVKAALRNSGKLIPWHVVTITRDGQILEAF